MVLVFHINRSFITYKNPLLLISIIIFIFIHTSEILLHIFKECQHEEQIDVVYTWINGTDPKFQRDLDEFLTRYQLLGGPHDATAQRYNDRNELKFSLRSLEMYAPWINHVYIVTNGQIPSWLNLDYEKVTLISHKDIFEDPLDLPTFSSPAIESHLHKIPSISKRFIYFNDDTFLRSPVFRDDFISTTRGFLIYLAWVVPMCAVDCSWLFVADGNCDQACNNANCQMDGGDCDSSQQIKIIKTDNDVTDYDDYIINNTEASHVNLTFYEHLKVHSNISDVIKEHNRHKVIVDKMKRRKLNKTKQKNHKFNPNFDAYSASLQHTNRLLNTKYGFSLRKVPSHAPILIDRDIMTELLLKFEKEFVKTSRNRIRSADDVQFSFLYYYHLIHEKRELTIDDIFSLFDTDNSDTWSDTEIRTLATKLYDLPLTLETAEELYYVLKNCTKTKHFDITRDVIVNCRRLKQMIKHNKKLYLKNKFHYTIIKESEQKYVDFKMLTSNETQVMTLLDQVRKADDKKFVCLNDNSDGFYGDEDIKRLMLDFYLGLFPKSSKFELPAKYRNRFMYLEDYEAMLNSQKRSFFAIYLFLALLSFVFVFTCFRRNICGFVYRILNNY